MTTTYATRNLTSEESAKMMSGLILVTGGKTELIHAVLGVLADQGLGIFVATADDEG